VAGADPSRLFGIDIGDWVSDTVLLMSEPTPLSDRSHWVQAWGDTYSKLGGLSRSCGNKGCPRAAAFGLWYLGRLAPTSRTLQKWPVSRVVKELGRNASYAVIAADLYAEDPERSPREAWRVVRRAFRRCTGQEATQGEQGQVRVVWALGRAGLLR
jgi:hypothetical protein